ncbi:F0F1 ATP synthase subunit B [Streptococcus ferus]|uniref:F0F1 ATP synthase subunit B n=1 Tax=Streptococcus ferus TaxID=1345 RepID=UPI003518531F
MSTLINSTSLGNLIIVTGSFVLLLVLIKKFAWTQLTDVFKAREEKIANDLDKAESSRKNAEDLESRRQIELSHAKGEANQIIETAKETGKTNGAKLVAEAKEEAGRLKEKAQQDIEISKTEAFTAVKSDVADLSLHLAEKLISKNLDQEAHSQLIDSYLDKLGEVK